MILAIDTSANVAVSLVRGDVVLAARSEDAPRAHAELLSGFIRDVMAQAHCEAGDLEYVVVGTGPAPFTGLRVGLVTARTLGFAWGIPVLGVCSLDALGARYGDVTAVTDARRKEVYWARYRDGVRVDGPAVGSPESVGAAGLTVGRGAQMYAQHFPGALSADVDPAWLASVAARRVERGESVERDFPTEPLYLRRPDIQGVPPTPLPGA